MPTNNDDDLNQIRAYEDTNGGDDGFVAENTGDRMDMLFISI